MGFCYAIADKPLPQPIESMSQSQKLSRHYLALVGIVALGTVLRFWHLDLKPLWLDEVLTAFFILGRHYNDLPLDIVFSPSTLEQILTLQPEASCGEIARTLAAQSTHPPLFFCLMHSWLRFMGTDSLVWALRSLPAGFGVAGIVAVYCLNRLVFYPTAGLIAAALMAVSPFAVYLSQEARHYTLPMLLITLALLGLIEIQHRLYSQQQPHPTLWLFWVAVNSIGCYVHYFFILAVVAQVLTLVGLMLWHRQQLSRGSWIDVLLAIAAIAVSYLPQLSVLLGDFGRPETEWLPTPDSFEPLFQLLIGWLLMVIALPVENQPLWVAVPMGVLTIGFGGWVVWQGFRGIQQLWRKPSTQLATLTLSGFIVCVLLQFLAIIYLLDKDISVVPRYHFVYYPAICALLGASFALEKGKNWRTGEQRRWDVIVLLGASLLSTVFVVSNLVFIKPFHPQQVAQNMNLEPTAPLMIVVGYSDIQDVALGLSFALALDQGHGDSRLKNADTFFAFLNREQGYQPLWQKLSELQIAPVPRLNLWVVAPGLKRRDYPQQLAIASQQTCTLDPTQHYRIGIPYQLYRCYFRG
ncbi:glycosyltransferase family 39 protein, partial [Coleofasciculus sp. LEGE 07081]